MENQAHIYIYGIIDSYQDKDASDYGYSNLSNVRDQLERQENYDEIVVHIHSEGGVVTEGFAIHDYLRSQGKKVITQIDGVCASIATVILLAGDERIGTENSTPFIHNPWGMSMGDKEELRKYADELEKIEEDIANFYAAKTNLSKEQALEFMREETYFSAEQCLSNGFLTKINSVMRAVALLKHNNSDKMAKENLTKEEAKGLFDSLFDKIQNILSPKKDEVLNKTVTDANGTIIDFPDVEEDAEPAVGDSALVDGAPADGEYLMPDGSKMIFTAGELSEVAEASEEGDEDDMEALKAENEELKAEIDQLKTANAELNESIEAKDSEIEEIHQEVSNIKEGMEELKNSLGSDFTYEPKKKNFKNEKKATRSVWKQTEE